MLLKGLKADLIPLLVILLVPLLIIGGALIPGRTLLPVDLLSGYAAWQGSVDNPKLTNGLLSDIVLQFYPWHKLAYDNARETGQFPTVESI